VSERDPNPAGRLPSRSSPARIAGALVELGSLLFAQDDPAAALRAYRAAWSHADPRRDLSRALQIVEGLVSCLTKLGRLDDPEALQADPAFDSMAILWLLLLVKKLAPDRDDSKTAAGFALRIVRAVIERGSLEEAASAALGRAGLRRESRPAADLGELRQRVGPASIRRGGWVR